MKILLYLLYNEEGQGLVEYSLIITLIVIAALGAVQLFGIEVGILYNNVVSKLLF